MTYRLNKMEEKLRAWKLSASKEPGTVMAQLSIMTSGGR